MLDVIFAVSVLVAVIFFGALLSIGNERQRKAIDGIREQTAYWAEQDLRLKRARALREVHVENPNLWLAGIIVRVTGEATTIISLHSWTSEEARAIVGTSSDGRRYVITPMPPQRFIRAIKPKSRSRLQQAEVGLLGDHPKRIQVYELSIVTAGAFFDLEATQAWQLVTHSHLGAERLYLFEVPAPHSN
ncbi:MAG: hypothetical protein JNM55_21105 [Anaerolineales bacterium]|nr:hypothetical protein [Anaerolineales bacterium]